MATGNRRTGSRGNTARSNWRPALTRLSRQMERTFRQETTALRRRLVQEFRIEGARIAGRTG